MPVSAQNANPVVRNALFRYYEHLRAAARMVAAERYEQPIVALEPGEAAPELRAFTDVTDIGLSQVDSRVFLLDLMRNPGARTTKTIASLFMIARAADHIRRTGERVLLLTPTSGNKGSALRDAVARAYASGLATPEQLRIVTVVPEASTPKLRDCPLSDDSALRAANPLCVARVEQAADVKQLTAAVVERHADELLDATGFRLWYTLDLDNYRIADAARAFVEAELMPIKADSPPRMHIHAVSSAFGLLGYHLGHRLLAEGAPHLPAPAFHPGFFLVQHLATPDMVTSLLGTKVPDYEHDAADGVWRQRAAPQFPSETDDPEEVIDATFYTRSPVTSPQVNEIVAEHGGGGVVVSRRECLARYRQVRALAAAAGIEIESDPSRIREWSLIKVLTGVLVSRERRLIPEDTDIVVHASGYYSDALIPPVAREHVKLVSTVEELFNVLLAGGQA